MLLASISTLLLIAGSNDVALAQPAPPDNSKEFPGAASNFQEKFVDVGNEGAKALAQQEGITVGEATRRLRLMHAAANIGAKLNREDAANFGGVMFVDGQIRVFAKEQGGKSMGDKARAAIDPDLRGAVQVVAVEPSAGTFGGLLNARSPPNVGPFTTTCSGIKADLVFQPRLDRVPDHPRRIGTVEAVIVSQ